MEIDIRPYEKNFVKIVDIIGEIDSIDSDTLADTLIELVEQGYIKIIVNFKYVEYIFSSGIGALVRVEKKLRNLEGEIYLTFVNSKIKEILEMTGVDKVIRIRDTDSIALEELNRK